MRRLFFTIALLLAVSAPLSASAAHLTDVANTDPDRAAMEMAVNQGVFTADNGIFRPNDPMTRAEVVKTALRAAGYIEVGTQRPTYTDVAADDPLAPSIARAQSLGIISKDAPTFRPKDVATRVEALKIMLASFSVTPTEARRTFRDVPADAWFAPYASLAVERGFLRTAAKEFGPDRPFLRRDGASVLGGLIQSRRAATIPLMPRNTLAGLILGWILLGLPLAQVLHRQGRTRWSRLLGSTGGFLAGAAGLVILEFLRLIENARLKQEPPNGDSPRRRDLSRRRNVPVFTKLAAWYDLSSGALLGFALGVAFLLVLGHAVSYSAASIAYRVAMTLPR